MLYQHPPDDFVIEFEAAGCVCEHDGKILLLQRNDDDTFGGSWCLPAGGLEPGEDVYQAMIREAQEEINVTFQKHQLNFLEKSYVEHGDKQFVFHFFHTKMSARPDVKINSNEHQNFLWCTPQEALYLRLLDDLDTFFKKIYNLS